MTYVDMWLSTRSVAIFGARCLLPYLSAERPLLSPPAVACPLSSIRFGLASLVPDGAVRENISHGLFTHGTKL